MFDENNYQDIIKEDPQHGNRLAQTAIVDDTAGNHEYFSIKASQQASCSHELPGWLTLETSEELVLVQRKSPQLGVPKEDGIQKPGRAKDTNNPKDAANAKTYTDDSPSARYSTQEGELVLQQVGTEVNRPGVKKDSGK